MLDIHKFLMVLVLVLTPALVILGSSIQAGGQSRMGLANPEGSFMISRLDKTRDRTRDLRENQHRQYDRRPYLPPLRINRVYLRGAYVIVELKRHGSALLTDADYTNTRVTVSAHPSGVPYHQVMLSAMDRLRHLNSDIRLINWVTPLVLSGPASVAAKLRFRGRLYTKTQGLVP